jgi:uncharacterized membrane protein YciS (DUF1049 family)
MSVIKSPEEFEAIWPTVLGVATNVVLTIAWSICAFVYLKHHFGR